MIEGLLLALRICLSLGAVLLLMWFLARRFGANNSNLEAPITVTGRQALTRRSSVLIVEVDQRRFLLGVVDSQVTLIAELGKPTSPEPQQKTDHDGSSEWEQIIADAEWSTSTPRRSFVSLQTWKDAGASLWKRP